MRDLFDYHSDLRLVCMGLEPPVCPDAEEGLLRATQEGGGLERVDGVLVHALVKFRGVLLVTSEPCTVHFKKRGFWTGIIEDPLFGGFIAVPCGRDQAFRTRGFVLARLLGDPELGADDFLEGWLAERQIKAHGPLTRAMEYDAPAWLESWKAISHL